VTKATDARGVVPWWGQIVDYRTGEVTEGLVPARYRTWSMSRRWGLTMAAVKAQGLAYVKLIEQKREAEGLVLLLAAFGDDLITNESPPAPS
jgi:hypothetical protein